MLNQLHGNIRQTEPQFRFAVIIADADDNKFCDCAITAEADFVVTDDASSLRRKAREWGVVYDSEDEEEPTSPPPTPPGP